MYLRISILILFYAWGSKGQSQNKYVDSLINEIRIENPYESRVNSINLLIQHYQYRNKAFAFQYIDSLFTIARLNKDSFRIGIAWNYSADTHLMHSNYERARLCAIKADSIGKATGNLLLLFGSNNSLGMIESDMGNFENAINYYQQGYQAASASQDSMKQAIVLSNLGGAYLNLGNYDKAISKMFEALEYLENDNSEDRKAITITSISGALLGSKDYDKAIYYGTQAAEIFRKTRHIHTMPVVLNNIGEALNATKKYNEAMEYFYEGISFAITTNNTFSLSYCYHGLGNSYLELGNIDSAQYYYTKAFDLEIEHGLKLEQSSSLASLGEIFLRTGEFKKAKSYLKKAENLANETQTIDELTDIKRLLIQTELAEIGDKNLETTFLEFRRAKDSLYNSDKLIAINDVREKYETEKKEQQIKILAHQNELQQSAIKRRNSYLIGSAIGGLGLITSLILLLQKRRKEKELFKNSVKRLKTDNAILITKNLNLKKPTLEKQKTGEAVFMISDQDLSFDIADITYIASSGNYVDIFLKGKSKPVTIRYSLQDYYEDFLNKHQYLRIHRQYVVNIGRISKLTSDKAHINHNGKVIRLNVGRTYKVSVQESYNSIEISSEHGKISIDSQLALGK